MFTVCCCVFVLAIENLTDVEAAPIRARGMGGAGGSLEPPGSLVFGLASWMLPAIIEYSECPRVLLNPLAERALPLGPRHRSSHCSTGSHPPCVSCWTTRSAQCHWPV